MCACVAGLIVQNIVENQLTDNIEKLLDKQPSTIVYEKSDLVACDVILL